MKKATGIIYIAMGAVAFENWANRSCSLKCKMVILLKFTKNRLAVVLEHAPFIKGI